MSTPIMCTLTPEAIEARRAGLLSGLIKRATSSEVVDDGRRLTFTASTETLESIAAVIDAERQCCRWLRFDLIVSADGGPMVLTLSGPPGAREFLDALLDE